VKSKNRDQQEINLLELIPLKNIEWEQQTDGLICLLKPKFQISFLRKRLLPHLKNPYYRINLDKIGSHFWESCDGVRNVKEIAECMKIKFGDDVEPLYERITLFLQNLEKNKFIRFL
jgi:hypothetical protein